jgi:hypothetical protein
MNIKPDKGCGKREHIVFQKWLNAYCMQWQKLVGGTPIEYGI